MSPATLINLASALALVTFTMTAAFAVLTIINLKRVRKNKLRIDALAHLLNLFMDLNDGDTPKSEDIKYTEGLIDMLKPNQIH